MFKIVGGDFPLNTQLHGFGSLTLAWKDKNIVLHGSIKHIELMTEEKAKSFLGALGCGVIGGLVLGPIGAIAGLLAGGNKKEVCFACYLKDGRKFMAIADPKTYQKLAALAF